MTKSHTPVFVWKFLVGICLFMLAQLLTGCHPASPTPIQPLYTLSVINGFGSGSYAAGSTVHIWANPYPQGWTFATWIGDTQPVPDVRSMHATIRMPAQDIQLESTYKKIPVWSASFSHMAGTDVYYYLPSTGFKGLILFFHGSGGDAREWANLGMERRHFFDDAIADGYAILAMNSADRVNKQWDLDLPLLLNPDLQVLETILRTFRADGRIPEIAPVYSVGMSRGGQFANIAAYSLGMKASALWVSAGLKDLMAVSTVPTMWCLADHDPIIDRQEAAANYYLLKRRGVDTEFYIHAQTPLYPLYFVNIEGINEAASEKLFSQFKSKGFLDGNNFLIENPRSSRWELYIGLDFPEAVLLDIQDRLFVAYGEHAFYSDCDHHVLDFFDSHSPIQ